MAATKELQGALAEAMTAGPSSLISLLGRTGKKSVAFDVSQAVGGLVKATERQEFCDRLLVVLEECLAPVEAQSDGVAESSLKSSKTNKDKMLGVVAVLIRCFLERESWIAPPSLFSMMLRLHDEIFNMSSVPVLQNELSELCELWYLQNRSSRDALAPQMLTYLLAKTLANDSKVVDIKRLVLVKDALELLDWEDESALQLRIMIQRTFLHAQFLSTEDGKRFLIWAFCHLPLVTVIHKTIKTGLVQCPKWKQLVYANLYYRSWEKSEGPARLRLESIALQDLVNASLHLQNLSVLKTVKVLLQYLVDQKARDKQVEDLLHRMYSPFIFRALQVANPLVRENALYQLGIIFPLVPPTLPQGEFDEVLQEQFHLIVDALDDPAPNVRSQAVLSIGRILAIFWEILPTQSLHTIITFLVEDIAFDQSSPHVREAVFKVMTAIVEGSVSSHRLLAERGYLAKLAPLMFDSSDKVRLACVSLLQSVKKLKKIKFYEIVDFDQLLDALAHEPSLKIQAAISSVLLPSYWPITRHPIEEIVSRAVGLVTSNPEAAVRFFVHAKMKDPLAAAQFIVQLWHRALKPTLAAMVQDKPDLVKAVPPTKAPKKGSRAKKAAAVEEEEGPEAKRSKLQEAPLEPTLINLNTLVQIVEGIWSKIESKLTDKTTIQTLLQTFDDETLLQLQSACPHPAIASIASRLPAKVLTAFSRGVLDTVTDPGKAENADSHATRLAPSQLTLIPCLFAWDAHYAEGLMEILVEHLEKGSSAHRRHAMRILGAILDSDLLWVRQSFLQLPSVASTLLDSLHVFRIEADSLLKGRDSEVPSDVIVEALSLRLRLLVHLACLDSDSFAERAEFAFGDALTWTEQKILPYLEEQTREKELDLDVESKAPSELKFALDLSAALLLVFNDYLVLLDSTQKPADATGSDSFADRFWVCLERALKVRSYADFLKIVSSVGWKLVARASLAEPRTVVSSNFRDIQKRSMMVLLLTVRDTSLRKRMSITALRALAKSKGDIVGIALDHLWISIGAQLEDDFTHELDLNESLPAELEATLSAYGGSTPLVQTMVNWMAGKLNREKFSPSAVWTCIQISALVTRPTKRTNAVNVSPFRELLTKLMGSMRETIEEEATLRSRMDQLLTSSFPVPSK